MSVITKLKIIINRTNNQLHLPQCFLLLSVGQCLDK